jgi:hypothetical protein
MWDSMDRYLAWSIFVLFTLGTVDFDVKYADEFQIHYHSWLENLIEKVKE